MNASLLLSLAIAGGALLSPPPSGEAAEYVDFDTQVMPVLTKSGCNAGACHGAATGQGGFKLSLWGQDPAADHESIVRELEGRRVNLAQPDRSLLLQKPAGILEHAGGVLLEFGTPGAEIIENWIAAGAARRNDRQLSALALYPASPQAIELHESSQMQILAHFNGGAEVDVTPWASYTSTDPASLGVDAAGRVTALRRGQSVVLVRYLDRIAAVQFLIPFSDEPLAAANLADTNLVDKHVDETLRTLRLAPAAMCDDAAFLRRATLDLTGMLPEEADVQAMLADVRPERRESLIDRLLASDSYADYWTMKWSQWLRIDSQRMDREGALAFREWLRRRVAEDAPVDQTAVALLTSAGDSHEIGPANFSRASPAAREQAEHVSQLFLGARLGCANCHNHPLDRWTQDDYHGLAAIFARLERGRQVGIAPRGEVTHPKTGRPATMRLPGERFLPADADGRQALAAWLIEPANRALARNFANRAWQAMFGRGLVEPIDDLRATNPATHAALLDELAAMFVQEGYRLKPLLRTMALSQAYQRGPARQGAPLEDRFYSVSLEKPLPPEVLLDAIAQVTGVPDVFERAPAGTRAVQLLDARVPSATLDVLGRCSRQGTCESGVVAAGLPAMLHLMNGPAVNSKFVADDGWLAKSLAGDDSDQRRLESLYMRALGRRPMSEEQTHWLKELSSAATPQDRRERWQDLMWSMLVSREFTHNH